MFSEMHSFLNMIICMKYVDIVSIKAVFRNLNMPIESDDILVRKVSLESIFGGLAILHL